MRLQTVVSIAAVVTLLASCKSYESTVPEQPARMLVPPSYQTTRGTGEVRGIRDEAITALGDRRYQCTEMGGPLRDGVTVRGRTLSIDVNGEAISVRTTVKNDSLLQGEVVFGAGRYRTLMTATEPLVGEDTLALPLLKAAASADCSKAGK